jgi:hypothetical protein
MYIYISFFINSETNDGLKSSSYNHRRRAARKRGDDQRRECRREGGHEDQEGEEREERGNGVGWGGGGEMKKKKALEELGKVLEELVEERGEGQQSQQLPVGCVHDVDEAQAQQQEKKEFQLGALQSLWP